MARWGTARLGNLVGIAQGVAGEAATYPPYLCAGFVRGMANQLKVDGRVHEGEVGITDLEYREAGGILTVEGLKPNAASGQHKDDLGGQTLAGALVLGARELGLDYFENRQVWDLKGRVECFRGTGGPPVTVRWVVVSKGDGVCHNYPSRLVARQARGDGTGSIFAGAPPPDL